MAKKYKQIKKDLKENEPVYTKYSWKFWCVVIAEIAIIAIIILWLCLSIKAIVQNIQMLYFENKVVGTVTVAEYEGGKTVHAHNANSSVSSTEYEHIHYVIEFDNAKSGYSRYEFQADDIISSRKYEGQRFLVLFNEIDNPTLIRQDAVAADNFFLVSFIVFCAVTAVFRKKIYLWIKQTCEKIEGYI